MALVFESDCLLEVLRRSTWIFLHEIHSAQVVECIRILGVQLACLLKMNPRILQIAVFQLCQAQLVVKHRVFLVATQRLLEVLDGVLVVLLRLPAVFTPRQPSCANAVTSGLPTTM